MKDYFEPKKKMQSVKFAGIDELWAYLPPDQRQIAQQLRQIVFEAIPNAKEKLSFNVPFYSGYRGICFIWPAAITWGQKQAGNGVRFGFLHGNLIPDALGYLDKGNRKMVAYHQFNTLTDINIPLLKSYLAEALMIDQLSHRPKRPKK